MLEYNSFSLKSKKQPTFLQISKKPFDFLIFSQSRQIYMAAETTLADCLSFPDLGDVDQLFSR